MSRSKKNKAVALKYNAEEDVAPIVIASGYGELAQRIIDVAEKQGIPVFRDDSAVSLMCMLEVGSNIPPRALSGCRGNLLPAAPDLQGDPGWHFGGRTRGHGTACRRFRPIGAIKPGGSGQDEFGAVCRPCLRIEEDEQCPHIVWENRPGGRRQDGGGRRQGAAA